MDLCTDAKILRQLLLYKVLTEQTAWSTEPYFLPADESALSYIPRLVFDYPKRVLNPGTC